METEKGLKQLERMKLWNNRSREAMRIAKLVAICLLSIFIACTSAGLWMMYGSAQALLGVGILGIALTAVIYSYVNDYEDYVASVESK